MNTIMNIDCMEYMKTMDVGSVNVTLTDIPYTEVNRTYKRNTPVLRSLNKMEADIMTFNLSDFLKEVYRITSGTIIIFCGKQQFSDIYKYFSDTSSDDGGTVRQIIWEKTNPSPMNGKMIYLSGIENAVWFRKPNATFNAFCKNTVFHYPSGTSNIHPTEKNHNLLKELIVDNSNEGDIIFDPCAGSGSHLLCAKELRRKYLGCELNPEWCKIANDRLEKCRAQFSLF